jgi:transcriptional regulator with XRE-family HTH domain
VADVAHLAENVRRAAGAHLVSLDALAQHVGMTRPGLMKLLADDGEKRTSPRGTTVVALAEAFGVDVRDLIADDPRECLQAVVDAFDSAPIRAAAKVPSVSMRQLKRVAAEQGIPVIQFRSKTQGGRNKTKG